MTKQTSTVTQYSCNACNKTKTIGGDSPDTIIHEMGWETDQIFFGMTVDLCDDCVGELKDFIRWKSMEDRVTAHIESLGMAVADNVHS